LKKIVPSAQVSCDPSRPLPFPADLDHAGLRRILGTVPHTPLETAIRETISP
jgi:hypothetical protein